MSAQISCQGLEEIDRCARQVIQAATMYQQALALESDVLSTQPHEVLTKQEGLAEAIAHYNYAIEKGIESKMTGTIADMVVALAEKLTSEGVWGSYKSPTNALRIVGDL
ncbi:MAG: hypothetical protein F6K26_41355 [Moorea sp. SIO2I5]|nr:hypothetical protein [Moorena sp. SIO2I5]